MPQSYKQKVENLKKGRETLKLKREHKITKQKEEKEKLDKMTLIERQNYKNEQENKEFKRIRKGIKKVVGIKEPLEKFKTSDYNNISVRSSNAKNTLIIDVVPDSYSKKLYNRKYVKKFGEKLSKYLNDIGIDGKIQVETNFTDEGYLYKTGRQVDLGNSPDLYEEYELSYVTRPEHKTQIQTFDKFNGMRFFVHVDSKKDVKTKFKKY
jgi:hypothetical protein